MTDRLSPASTHTASDWRTLPPDRMRPAYDALVQQIKEQMQLAVEMSVAADACDLFPDAPTAGEAVVQANAWADAIRANSQESPMAKPGPVLVSPSPAKRLPVTRLPEAVRRQMIAAHCAALCAWLNRMAIEAEGPYEGANGEEGNADDVGLDGRK